MGLNTEHYQTAKSNGISRQLAYCRYKYLYWSIEDAITKTVGNDEDYRHWKDVALSNGMSYVGFRNRINQGMTPEAAATATRRKPGRKKEGA